MDFKREAPDDFSLYYGVSERPLGWKRRKSIRTPTWGSTAKNLNIKRFDGEAGVSSEWDGLRKDPELWFPEGNCLIHLYGQGASKRGPAFRVPFEALLATNCGPLLDRCKAQDSAESTFLNHRYDTHSSKLHELYIPAPSAIEKGQAFLYHLATRNFLAWVFGKPLVGTHLGGALVGLLNSMTEFRSEEEDNVPAIIDYMIDAGYADMRNNPDHALAALFFAEHFHFRDLWIDAHAHCTGMSEKLCTSPGFEHLSDPSTALISSSRFETHMRLDTCGRMLSSFLSDELSESHLGLSSSAREHLDKFRSFLQSFFIAKLGYYPPQFSTDVNASFPKNVYGQMCSEFQNLYDFLVDSRFSTEDIAYSPISAQGGICCYQNLLNFDKRFGFSTLPHNLPHLPEVTEIVSMKSSIRKRMSWVTTKAPDKAASHLAMQQALSNATNYEDHSLLNCSLVRAYRGFEKQSISSENTNKLSLTYARKVRWILIYCTLQVLLQATKVPHQVWDTQNVPYNLCLFQGLPWDESIIYENLIRTQTDQVREDFDNPTIKNAMDDRPKTSHLEITPDIDYYALTHSHTSLPEPTRSTSSSSLISRRSSVRKALSVFSNSVRAHHEILIQGYGNVLKDVNITTRPLSSSPIEEKAQSGEALAEQPIAEQASDSGSSTLEDSPSRWSKMTLDDCVLESPATSVSSTSRRSSGTTSQKDLYRGTAEELDRVFNLTPPGKILG